MNFVIAPELEQVLVVRRGILTVPAEDALARCKCPRACSGLAPDKLPLRMRQLELYVMEMAEKFQSRQAIRGHELVGGLVLHGPFPSYNFNDHLSDVQSSIWNDTKPDKNGDEHPEHALTVVFEREMAFNPYMDYLLVGTFLKQAVLTEVISKEE